MYWNFLGLLTEMRWSDVLDVAAVSLLLWIGIQAVRTTRARSAGLGLLLLAGIFVAAQQLELELTVWLIQGVAALFVLVVVVVFQDEIRRLFGGLSALRERFRDGAPFDQEQVTTLTETIVQLARDRTGALLVFQGFDDLEGLATGGVPLEALPSKPLLLSLFDASSPGHDGALIFAGGRVVRFGAHLPLSTDSIQLRERGTRHAAALGLSDACDATVLVVSEETGRVSVARSGTLEQLSEPVQAARVLEACLSRHTASSGWRGTARVLLRRVGLEGLIALAIALSLWLVLIPGSVVEERSFHLPVVIQNVPAGFELQEASPSEVEVVVSGARRALYLLDPTKYSIRIDATLSQLGRRTFALSPSHLMLAPELEVVSFSPSQVKVLVRAVEKVGG